MAQRIDGTALGIGAAGGLLVYAGIKGKSIPALVQGFVQGKSPSAAAESPAALAAGAASPGPASAASTSAIASDALQYKGAGYVWAGKPALGVGIWDCSSFANWVCGHDLGLPIPGYTAGSYTGTSHGPPTGVWLFWSGLTTIGNGGQMQPGDLAIWETHMGIVTGDNEMISAQNPTDGTQVSAVRGFIPGEVLVIRRYKQAGPLATIGSAGPH